MGPGRLLGDSRGSQHLKAICSGSGSARISFRVSIITCCMCGRDVCDFMLRPRILLRGLFSLYLRVDMFCIDRSKSHCMNGSAGEAVRLELADASRGKKWRD